MIPLRQFFVLLMVWMLSACSVVNTSSVQLKPKQVQTSTSLPSVDAVRSQLPECLAAYRALDKLASQHAGTLVGNRIGQLPWLRHNRSIMHQVKSSGTQRLAKHLKAMSSLARKGLSIELRSVPKQHLQHWQNRHNVRQSPDQFSQQCTKQLIDWQLKSPKKTLVALQSIPPENDYSTLSRVVGLYPLATIPFRVGVAKEQRQLRSEWGQIEGKKWFEYSPEVTSSIAKHRMHRLLASHAPVWRVNGASAANIPGAPVWQNGQLTVNQQATTFAFVSEGRWKEQPVTQLNYVIWFPERPPLKRLDWVAGKHDAVLFRVHLNPQHEVLAYDSIHLCGCWYRLFLSKRQPFVARNNYWQEPVLMHRVHFPRKNQRNVIYLQANTHHIQFLQPLDNLKKSPEIVTTTRYELLPFEHLLALPHPSGGVKSVFNAAGYVPGSNRLERWFFWPMGVKNLGALRRIGDHAISFVGRRYFDDPELLEKVMGLK